MAKGPARWDAHKGDVISMPIQQAACSTQGCSMKVAASADMKRYFRSLQDEADRCYGIARDARKLGLDPETDVEIPQAEDLASRVEKLLNFEGIAGLIRETARKHNREEMSIIVAKKVAADFPGPKDRALDLAVRVGLAVLTEGILVAPLDGIGEVKIHGSGKNSYASISFAGPIRSAGGTGQAMSVLIADVVRSTLDIGPYVATDQEVERWKEELPMYRRAANLQYLPTDEEIEYIIRGCRVCVDGEGTEDAEISGYRDLPRIETNRVRGGACLVVAEGLALKAKKLKGHVKKLKIQGWDFLGNIVKEKDDDPRKGLEPSEKFIKDMVAGRPVYSHPSRKGGFRLRYGRSRTAGLASISVHPAVMYLLGETMAVGTQIKIERPGKAGISTPCDMLEGPTVLLKNGDLVRLDSAEVARELNTTQIDKIVELGEILIPVGEFLENNHPLVPGVFDAGWYLAELEALGIDEPADSGLEASLCLAREKGVPLHPAFTFMWNNLSVRQVMELGQAIASSGKLSGEVLEVGDIPAMREYLLELRAPYRVKKNTLHVANGPALLASLGIADTMEMGDMPPGDFPDALALVSHLAGCRIMDKRGTYIGTRMARPEKAAMRKMDPPVHGLFPVGDEGGTQRLMSKAAEGKGRITAELEERACRRCKKITYLTVCDCGEHTVSLERTAKQELDIYMILKRSSERIGMGQIPKVKGVRGLVSKHKTPEMPEKGMLRAKHGVFVFKDGTSRFDCTDAPLTHFKPSEIETGIPKLHELGYTRDIHGKPLESDDQVLELRVQDVVAPEGCGDYFLQVSRFIDELLTNFYGQASFYNARNRHDLVGAALLGLSPHTSGGVLCRLVGFSKAAVGYAHPFFHAAKRRNCFAPDTRIWARSEKGWELTHIKELVDNGLKSKNIIRDDFGTVYKDEINIFVPSISKTGEQSIKAVTAISRHPGPEHMIELKTKAGRKIIVTPEHKMLRMNSDLEFQPAHSLKPGDMLPSPKRLDICKHEERIDILKMLSEAPGLDDDLMVRNISKEWIDKCFKNQTKNYLETWSKTLGINKKTLSSYIQRRSIPLWILREVLGDSVFDAIPEDVNIGVRRDKVNVNRYLEMTEGFCKLLGYYTAEGYSRESDKEFAQVTICIPDEAPRRLIIDEFRKGLGIEAFRENKWKITVSSRIVYHLFNDILMAGSNAGNKCIPKYVISSGSQCLSSYLSGYFSGDGSTSRNRLDIRATTISERLANELVESLKVFGINSKIYTETRGPGGFVKDFCLQRGKEVKTRKFTSHVIKITSDNVSRFNEKIGFDIARKSEILSDVLESKEIRAQKLMKDGGDVWLDEIVEKNIIKNSDEHVYSLTVDDNHTLVANDLYTGQCDGDEDCFMLLMDGLLNFSVSYLPEKRGGRMDAPLVLMTRIDPNEIDKEAHNIDVMFRYPLEVYTAGLENRNPKTLEKILDTVGSRIGSNLQYEGFGYTLDTADISEGPTVSAYKTLNSMDDKTQVQLGLARMIMAVDERDVAERLLNNHFIPDMIGNLRTFSKQSLRCTKCGAKFRRMPLAGKCRCGNKLNLTVHVKSVMKYLEMSKAIAIDFGVSNYVSQRIELLEEGMCSMFENDKVKDCKITDFF